MSLKDIIKADLRRIYNPNEFGTPAVYHKSSGDWVSTVIMTSQAQDAAGYGDGQADLMTASVIREDVDQAERGDAVEIDGVFWRVESVTGDEFTWTAVISKDPRYAR